MFHLTSMGMGVPLNDSTVPLSHPSPLNPEALHLIAEGSVGTASQYLLARPTTRPSAFLTRDGSAAMVAWWFRGCTQLPRWAPALTIASHSVTALLYIEVMHRLIFGHHLPWP